MRPRDGERAGDFGQQLLGMQQHLRAPCEPGNEVDLPRMTQLSLSDLAVCKVERCLKEANHLLSFGRAVSGSSIEQLSRFSALL